MGGNTSGSRTDGRRKQKGTAGSEPGGGGPPTGGPEDPCDLKIDSDLEGVRASALDGLAIGDRLSVVLDREGAFPSVVCRRADGRGVGALSAFRNLTRLITCLQDGVVYEVAVTRLDGGNCHVVGGRVAT